MMILLLTSPFQIEVMKKSAAVTKGDNESPFFFDVAMLSECLSMHRTCFALAKSVYNLLHPESGISILTYTQHIPGKGLEMAASSGYVIGSTVL
jgi:hypothetical protein